jgi:hypothetical protein
MNVTTTVTPAVTISVTSGSTTMCSGNSITFTAAPTNGGIPSYQWKIGSTTTGSNSATFTSSTLNNTDVVSCVMTSSLTCISAATATSNSYTMNVTTMVTPAIAISVTSGSTTMCSGNSITFTAAPTNGGTPSYQWKVGSTNAGSNSNTYTSTALNNADVVSCIMTSSLTCVSAANATSNTYAMQVTAPFTASALANSLASATVCENAALTLSANTISGATYSWSGPNSFTSGNQNPSITSVSTSEAGTYTVTVNAGGCSSQSSATLVVNANPSIPTISPDLSAMTLTSSSATGNQWYINGVAMAGETNQVLMFSPGGSYTVQVSNSTCTSESSPYTYTLSTATIETTLSAKILVYPNPSEGVFKISVKDQTSAQITVKDIYGTNLYSHTMNGSLSEINLSDLDKGIYSVHVTNGAEEGVVKMIIN